MGMPFDIKLLEPTLGHLHNHGYTGHPTYDGSTFTLVVTRRDSDDPETDPIARLLGYGETPQGAAQHLLNRVTAWCEGGPTDTAVTREQYAEDVKVLMVPEEHTHLDSGDLPGDTAFWVHTIGMWRYDRPELELRGVPALFLHAAGAEINRWAFHSITAKEIKAGETIETGSMMPILLRVVEAEPLGELRCLRLTVEKVAAVCHNCGNQALSHSPTPRFLFYCDHPNDDWGEGEVWVSLVREDFWNEHGHADDRHITADLVERDMNPSFLCEIMDSTFESSLSVGDTRARLEQMGFIQDLGFTEFSRAHDPFVGAG